jgi:hypothetical protein
MRHAKVVLTVGLIAAGLVAGCREAPPPPPPAPGTSAAVSGGALTPIECLGVADCVGQWTQSDGAVLTLQNHANMPIDEVIMAVLGLPGLHSTTPVEIGGQQRKALLYTRGRMTQLAVQDGANLVVASIDRVLPEDQARPLLTGLAARAF